MVVPSPDLMGWLIWYGNMTTVPGCRTRIFPLLKPAVDTSKLL